MSTPEGVKGPAESGQICSVGRRKIAKTIAKNKRCYANTLRPCSRMLLKVMKGGLGGSLPPGDRIYQLGLWSAIFFAIFLRLPPNKFLRFRRTFHQFRSGWLCYFCYSRAGRSHPGGYSDLALGARKAGGK